MRPEPLPSLVAREPSPERGLNRHSRQSIVYYEAEESEQSIYTSGLFIGQNPNIYDASYTLYDILLGATSSLALTREPGLMDHARVIYYGMQRWACTPRAHHPPCSVPSIRHAVCLGRMQRA